MSELELEILEHTNEKDIEDYEKKLFNAFNIETSWIGNNYQKIDNQRLRSNIPYENQVIFIVRDNTGSIIAASAINKDLTEHCQIQQMGYPFFTKYADRKGMCEGTGFYTIPGIKVNRFEIGHLFTTKVFEYMKNLGFNQYFATTAPKIARLYTKMHGFSVIDTFQLENQEEYVIFKAL